MITMLFLMMQMMRMFVLKPPSIQRRQTAQWWQRPIHARIDPGVKRKWEDGYGLHFKRQRRVRPAPNFAHRSSGREPRGRGGEMGGGQGSPPCWSGGWRRESEAAWMLNDVVQINLVTISRFGIAQESNARCLFPSHVRWFDASFYLAVDSMQFHTLWFQLHQRKLKMICTVFL